MGILRFMLKSVLLPVLAVLTILEWMAECVCSLNSSILNLISSIVFLITVLSLVLGISSAKECIRVMGATFALVCIGKLPILLLFTIQTMKEFLLNVI